MRTLNGFRLAYKLLQRMTRPRHYARTAARGQRHLGNINVAARIDPDVVRRKEIARCRRILAAAPARVQLAMHIEHTHAAACLPWLMRPSPRPPTGAKAQLGNVEHARLVDENLARPRHIGPLAEILPVLCEK